MSFQKFYCVTGLCDGCGEQCWETETTPHFANEREARETLAAQYGWRIERDVTGQIRMLCVRCAAREDCGKYGCDWGYPELDHASEQQARWDAEHPVPLQMCRRCGAVRRDLEPAAMTREPSAAADTSPAALNRNPIDDYTYRGDDT